MTDAPSTIAEAQKALKKAFPKVQFISATPSFLTAAYQRSPTSHAKVKATLTFPESYSSTAFLVVGIEGTNVPPGLKRKLEKELGEVAKSKKQQTFHQIQAVIKRLVEFLDSNHFVPCWKELRQVVELIHSSKQDTIRMNENAGLIKLSLQQGKYQYKFSIKIDPEYPNTANLTNYGKSCLLKVESTNLPSTVEAPITKHAMELVRRLQDGMSQGHALKMSNPILLPAKSKGKPDETEAEAWQRQDLERRKLYGVPLDPPFDGSNPQPSLLFLVQFLHSTIHGLAKEKCPSCGEPCLLADPASKTKAKQRSILVHCGHWYHWECMDQLMNQPPFGIDASCTECGKRLYHPDWTEETAAERERLYHQRQAREREIADAADFF